MFANSPLYFDIEKASDQNWLKQCKEVIGKYPIFSIAGAAGKFTENYCVWAFDVKSKIPLIENIRNLFEKNRELFELNFGGPARIDVIRISYSPDSSKEMCLWHQDGVYWNGQIHLTVQGHANIAITSSKEIDKNVDQNTTLIRKNPGDFWYLNSTNYLHKILPDNLASPRIEITIPVNIPEQFLHYYHRHFGDYPDGCYIYTKEIDELISYNKNSRELEKWSAHNTPDNERVVYTSDFLSPEKLYFFDDYMKIYSDFSKSRV